VRDGWGQGLKWLRVLRMGRKHWLPKKQTAETPCCLWQQGETRMKRPSLS
jgi:hypothetical protein